MAKVDYYIPTTGYAWTATNNSTGVTWAFPTCKVYKETDWYRTIFIARPRESEKKKSARVV